jgi:hypothetical protein
VLAHREVALIARLAAAIRARIPDAEVAAIYNAPLDAAELDELEAAGVGRVGSGGQAKWGEISLVDRVMEGLAEVADDRAVVLISGDSHPTPHLSAWMRRFADSGVHAALWGDEVVDDPLLDAHLRYRWRLWHRPPNAAGALVFRAVNAVSGRLGPRSRFRASPRVIAVGLRSRPLDVRHAKGDVWCALSSTARARLAVRAADPALRSMFVDSLIPDEAFVHTVALLDGWRVWRTKVMFTSWPYRGAPSPDQLGPDDLGRVVAEDTPFVRKVASPSGARLARALDALPAAELTRPSDEATDPTFAVAEEPRSDGG